MSRIPFDPEAIRSLANILRDNGLTEIELVDAESRLRIVRAPGMAVAASGAAGGGADGGAGAVQAVPAPSPAAPAEEAAMVGAVPSPMVGIVYLSPDPASAPFVVPGQAVAAGQTVLLIEAMKTFNQIKAPRAGTVRRILVASGDPVEYAQPLLVIE